MSQNPEKFNASENLNNQKEEIKEIRESGKKLSITKKQNWRSLEKKYFSSMKSIEELAEYCQKELDIEELKHFFDPQLSRSELELFKTQILLSNFELSQAPYIFHLTNVKSIKMRLQERQGKMSWSGHLWTSLTFLKYRFLSRIEEEFDGRKWKAVYVSVDDIQSGIYLPVLCIARLQPILNGQSKLLRKPKIIKGGDNEITTIGCLRPPEVFFINNAKQLETFLQFLADFLKLNDFQKKEANNIYASCIDDWQKIQILLKEKYQQEVFANY